MAYEVLTSNISAPFGTAHLSAIARLDIDCAPNASLRWTLKLICARD